MSGFILSPIGIIVIAIYSFAIISIALLIGWLMSRFLKLRPRWRWVLLAPPVIVLLALPWAEEAWISWHFKQACEDAGVKVYRTVEVEGYLDATSQDKRQSVSPGSQFPYNPTKIASFEKKGFRYYETLLTDGGARHLERVDDKVMVTILDKPESRYRVINHYQPNLYRIEEPIGWKLEKIERRVIDSQTGEILGRYTRIIRVLPTYEALIAGLFGPPIMFCEDAQPRNPQAASKYGPGNFPQQILKPVSQ